jgi:hypothetical protein
VQEVLPEMVSEDNTGRLSVNCTAAVPVLVEAVKDLRAENAELKARMARLEAVVIQLAPAASENAVPIINRR